MRKKHFASVCYPYSRVARELSVDTLFFSFSVESNTAWLMMSGETRKKIINSPSGKQTHKRRVFSQTTLPLRPLVPCFIKYSLTRSLKVPYQFHDCRLTENTTYKSKKYIFCQLHAISRTQQGRQRERSVVTRRSTLLQI